VHGKYAITSRDVASATAWRGLKRFVTQRAWMDGQTLREAREHATRGTLQGKFVIIYCREHDREYRIREYGGMTVLIFVLLVSHNPFQELTCLMVMDIHFVVRLSK
jgi:hypothetical protein